MKIGIAFTVKNCLQYTKEALDSMVVKTPHHLIIVDDFSEDGTKAFLAEPLELQQSPEGISILIDPETDSLAGKWNMAMQIGKENNCDAVLICNNDILFAPYTIDALVARLEKAKAEQEPIGMLTAHNIRADLSDPHDILTYPQPEGGEEAEHPDFSCFLITVETWETIRHFDENYVPCYFEDNDIHSMMKIYGIKAINVPTAPYYHYGSVTQNSTKGGVCSPEQFRQNRTYFIRKFGCAPTAFNLERARKRLGIKES